MAIQSPHGQSKTEYDGIDDFDLVARLGNLVISSENVAQSEPSTPQQLTKLGGATRVPAIMNAFAPNSADAPFPYLHYSDETTRGEAIFATNHDDAVAQIDMIENPSLKALFSQLTSDGSSLNHALKAYCNFAYEQAFEEDEFVKYLKLFRSLYPGKFEIFTEFFHVFNIINDFYKRSDNTRPLASLFFGDCLQALSETELHGRKIGMYITYRHNINRGKSNLIKPYHEIIKTPDGFRKLVPNDHTEDERAAADSQYQSLVGEHYPYRLEPITEGRYTFIIREVEGESRMFIGNGHHISVADEQKIVSFAGNIIFGENGSVRGGDNQSGGFHIREKGEIMRVAHQAQRGLLASLGLPAANFFELDPTCGVYIDDTAPEDSELLLSVPQKSTSRKDGTGSGCKIPGPF